VPRLRILFVVSECVPLIKTGGLGDVGGALPPELRRRGHDVRVVLPRYRAVKDYPARRRPAPLRVPTGVGELGAAVWETTLPGDVPAYLVEHDALFDRDGVYDADGQAFADNVLRFTFLSRAGLALGHHLDFEPDVIHVHDWPTALVPVFSRLEGGPATLLTIHNLGYQGHAGVDALGAIGMSSEQAMAQGVERYGVNLLRGGICSATMLSTVSPRYAHEIQTPEGGAGLHADLAARSADIVGILNGIDDETWDPSRDPHLSARYDADDLSGKTLCKQALQQELSLPEDPHAPLVGLVSRFVEQKGIDVFAGALERLVAMGCQIAVLGSGERWAEQRFTEIERMSSSFRVRLGFDEPLAHRIEAGADLFAMPSRYEPCGLNQMYSQRYGTLPIVRAVGGLRDTVEQGVDGFCFDDLSSDALVGAAAEAVKLYRHEPERFRSMQRTAMRKRMGWDRAAQQYDALYRLTLMRHAERARFSA
jgi:starch synthase